MCFIKVKYVVAVVYFQYTETYTTKSKDMVLALGNTICTKVKFMTFLTNIILLPGQHII